MEPVCACVTRLLRGRGGRWRNAKHPHANELGCTCHIGIKAGLGGGDADYGLEHHGALWKLSGSFPKFVPLIYSHSSISVVCGSSASTFIACVLCGEAHALVHVAVLTWFRSPLPTLSLCCAAASASRPSRVNSLPVLD